MKSKYGPLLVFVTLVVVAGCLGGGPADEATRATTGNNNGASGDTGGRAASSAWCAAGQTTELANPQTGEQATWEIHGIVTEDGRQACKATWQTTQGDIRQIEMYYTEDESYQKMITYDADGNVVNEVRLSDVSGADSGGAAGSDGASADWCSEASMMEFANPQTGEQVTMAVQGVVMMDGREVCKAVWEANQGDITRIELYYTEDESYQKMITYDADGNVVNEFETESG